jgi:mannose-1-phosphate guanylyltransferase
LHPSSGMTVPVVTARHELLGIDTAGARAGALGTTASSRSPRELWVVVLAGGAGVRLRPLTRVICGDERPKQYVTVTGSRSLLQQTLDRAGLRIPAARTVVVSVEAQASQLAAAMSGHEATVLLQPSDRGTAPGVLLPVHWIRQRAPDATVAVFPSDHLVMETEAFMDRVVAAAAYVDENPERIVLFGVQPTEPEPEYGWVEPGPVLDRIGGTPIRAVRRFIEKPSPETARACLAAGALWNTFVFVGKASALVGAGRRCVPRIHFVLERLMHAAGRGARREVLQRICAGLPRGNFSRDVLQNVTPMLAVTTLTGVTWCDWGSPRRVVASLERLGIRPSWLDHVTGPDDPGSVT